MSNLQYEIFDVLLPISNALVTWPGDPKPKMEFVQKLSAGDKANLSRLTLGSHTGTHVDAPLHFVDGGAPMDGISLDVLIGPALVLEMTGRKSISRKALDAADFEGVERVLFKTDNSNLWSDSEFHEDFCYIEPDAAEFLIARNIRLVGVDYLSVEKPGTKTHPTHRAFLDAGVVIIEGLNLLGVPEGDYELICLPLYVTGAEAAPARTILRRAIE